MYAITGATGQLGRLTIDALLERVGPSEIVAIVRDPGKVRDLAARGVAVRKGDYDEPETLRAAFAGIDKLLLVSSNALGQRVAQHEAVIAAAKAAGVGLVAYTSVLHADRSALGLAAEHRATEVALAASGLPMVLLRNGWYTENYLAGLAPALSHGVLMGGAGDGRISSAARADYAAAAAAVLTGDGHAGQTYELAGDSSYRLEDLAAEISRQAGKPVAYKNLQQADYETALKAAGLPAEIVALVADSDAAAVQGALFDDSGTLSRLIGRPTTPMPDSVTAALRAS